MGVSSTVGYYPLVGDVERAWAGFQYLPCVAARILIYDALEGDGMGGISVKMLDFRDLTEVLPGGHGSRLRKISEGLWFSSTSLMLFCA